MTPEWKLLCKILQDNDLTKVRLVNIDQSYFKDVKLITVWKFIEEHFENYRVVPSVATVEQKFDLKIDPVAEPIEYWISEVQNQKIEEEIVDVGQSINGFLTKGDPRKALEFLVDFSRDSLLKFHSGTKKAVTARDLAAKVWTAYEDAKAGKMGFPTPWVTMNEWCVSGDTLLMDVDSGKLVRIDDFCSGDNNEILSFSKGGISNEKIQFKGKTGINECIKVTTKTGRIITGTRQHPVLTPTGWKKLKDVVVGESVAIVSKYPAPKKIKKIPQHHVKMIAYLLSDGNYNSSHIRVANVDQEIIDDLSSIAKRFNCRIVNDGIWRRFVHGRNSSLMKRKKNGTFVRGQTTHPIRKMLEKYGMERACYENKKIPDIIFQLSEKQIALFLASYWNCDGCVSICSNSLNVSVNTVSRDMAYQISHLLMRLGIVSSIQKINASKLRRMRRDQYRVMVSGEFQYKFYKKIRLIKRKHKVFKNKVKQSSRIKNSLRIGLDTKNALRSIFNGSKSLGGSGSCGRGILNKIGGAKSIETFNCLFSRSKNSKVKTKDKIQKNVLKSIISTLKVKELEWIVNDDIYWDVISKKEKTKKIPVYDVTVPATGCFIANDFIVHNTMGWFKKDISFFVARSGVGKSFLLIDLAQAVVNAGHSVLFISCEMSADDIAQRYFAGNFKINYGGIRKGKLGFMDEQAYKANLQNYSATSDLEIYDGSMGLHMNDVEMAILNSKAEFVIIDSCYRITARQKSKDRFDNMAYVVTDLKMFAQLHDRAIVASTQLNREFKKKKKDEALDLTDIALSDVISWTSTNVFAMSKHEDQDTKKVTMRVYPLKIREGENQKKFMELNWDFIKMDFSEVSSGGTVKAIPGSYTDPDDDAYQW